MVLAGFVGCGYFRVVLADFGWLWVVLAGFDLLRVLCQMYFNMYCVMTFLNDMHIYFFHA